jgi:hypothetical protein
MDMDIKLRPVLAKWKRSVQCQLAFSRSKRLMKRLDHKPIPAGNNEIRLFTMARNESLRLPYFLDYYMNRGVDRVFLIDNNSTDDTVKMALQYDRVHVFQTMESFKNYYNWTESLLRRYGRGHWCVGVDLDEYLIYPHSERVAIDHFIEFLEQHHFSAVYCLLLDMYAGSDTHGISYQQGEDPLRYTPYFDPEFDMEHRYFHDVKFRRQFKTLRFGGGMRKRVFGVDPNCTKVPLFKFERGILTAAGMHAIDGAVVADVRGVVLHFKYLQDFMARSIEEADRQQHAAGAFLYKQMAEKLRDDASTNFYYEGAVKFESTRQLLDLGMMASSPEYESFVLNRDHQMRQRV